MKLTQFLMGLNEVFQLIRSSLLSRENLFDVKDAFAIVSRVESHRGIASFSYSSSGSVSKPRVSGFVAKTNNWSNNGNKRVDNNKKFRKSANSSNNRVPNSNLLCKNYGKIRHTVDRCFDLIGYPYGYNKNPGPKKNGYNKTINANCASTSNDNGTSLSFTNEQIVKLMNLINEVPFETGQANMEGRGAFFNNNVFFNINFKIFFNSNSVICKITIGWIIYSRANQHMTISTINMFGIIDITDLNLIVGHPNGTLAKIKYVGNLRLSKNVVLFDVLVVLEYCVSPLSVNKLIRESRMLPFLVLNDKSAFELVYGFKPKLYHLRSFGCLCYSSVLNNSDKVSTRSEKCVLISFSTTKMTYKVYSLESKLVFYSRDVKFYEIVFPFKINSSLQSIEENHDNNINNLNFFDEKHLDDQTSSLSPNNDGRVSSASNDDGNVQPCTRGFDTSDGSEADFATSIGDNPSSEGNVPSSSNLNTQNAQNFPKNTSQVQPNLRRSGRNVKLPAKLNDY
ncbi:ribonuclease H-like domain-containing protein [Tanacetum coccineum]